MAAQRSRKGCTCKCSRLKLLGVGWGGKKLEGRSKGVTRKWVNILEYGPDLGLVVGNEWKREKLLLYRSFEKKCLLVETGKDGTGALYQTVLWQGRGPVPRLPTTMVGAAVPQSVLCPLCQQCPPGDFESRELQQQGWAPTSGLRPPFAGRRGGGVGSRCLPILEAPQQDVRYRRNQSQTVDLGAMQERTEVASLVNLLRMVEWGLEKGSKGCDHSGTYLR